jgi:hypothetical protein
MAEDKDMQKEHAGIIHETGKAVCEILNMMALDRMNYMKAVSDGLVRLAQEIGTEKNWAAIQAFCGSFKETGEKFLEGQKEMAHGIADVVGEAAHAIGLTKELMEEFDGEDAEEEGQPLPADIIDHLAGGVLVDAKTGKRIELDADQAREFIKGLFKGKEDE